MAGSFSFPHVNVITRMVLDDFSAPGDDLTLVEYDGSVTGITTDESIWGGVRNVTLVEALGDQSTANVTFADGEMDYESDTGNDYLRLVYDAADTALDFTVNGMANTLSVFMYGPTSVSPFENIYLEININEDCFLRTRPYYLPDNDPYYYVDDLDEFAFSVPFEDFDGDCDFTAVTSLDIRFQTSTSQLWNIRAIGLTQEECESPTPLYNPETMRCESCPGETGFYPSTGTCAACPAGTYFSGPSSPIWTEPVIGPGFPFFPIPTEPIEGPFFILPEIEEMPEECTACNATCLTCDAEDSCTSCDVSRGLFEGECLESCPDGYFVYEGECVNNCYQFSLVQFDDTCLESCPDGTFDGEGTCFECSSNCATCNGGSPSDCLRCADTFTYDDALELCVPCAGVIFDGACVDACPDGFFDGEGTCFACAAECATCDGELISDCLSCSDGAILLENGECCSGVVSNDLCVSECPLGTFVDASSVCQVCDNTCLTCSGPSATECLSCESPLQILNGECTSECFTTQFFDEELELCVDCDGSCRTCDGPDVDNCLSCASGLISYRGQCLQNCPSNTIVVGNACEEIRCDTFATVRSISQGNPSVSASGSAQVVDYLCASGSQECVVEGATVEQMVTTTFTLTASVQCTVNCDNRSTQTFSQQFTAQSRVVRDEYQLSSAISPSSLVADASVEFSANSQIVQNFYRMAENQMSTTIMQSVTSICSGDRVEGASQSVSRQDIQLADLGEAGENGVCNVAYLSMLPSDSPRCICGSSVNGMNNPCAQVPLFSGMDAMCHPDQCTASSTDGTPVIQLILDEDYASFTDSDLEDLIDRCKQLRLRCMERMCEWKLWTSALQYPAWLLGSKRTTKPWRHTKCEDCPTVNWMTCPRRCAPAILDSLSLMLGCPVSPLHLFLMTHLPLYPSLYQFLCPCQCQRMYQCRSRSL